MRTGLRLFGAFDRIVLEARVGPDRYDSFANEYSLATGESCRTDCAFITRYNGWDNALDAKIYFDAPEWVVESLRLLGFYVMEAGNTHRMYYQSQYSSAQEKPYGYSVSSNDLFWWLIGYGYRLGENEIISFELHELREHLHDLEAQYQGIVPHVHLNLIEAENPVVEAKMFSKILHNSGRLAA
jgi:hypothetical protein